MPISGDRSTITANHRHCHRSPPIDHRQSQPITINHQQSPPIDHQSPPITTITTDQSPPITDDHRNHSNHRQSLQTPPNTANHQQSPPIDNRSPP